MGRVCLDRLGRAACFLMSLLRREGAQARSKCSSKMLRPGSASTHNKYKPEARKDGEASVVLGTGKSGRQCEIIFDLPHAANLS